MAVYLILMGIVLILAYPLIEHKPSVGKKLCYVIVTFGAMLCISVFRYGLGNDYYSYIYIFRKVSDATWLDMFNTGFEPGFVLLDKIISCFTTNVDIMFAVHAVLILTAVAYVVFKHSENIWLSTVMFISLTFFYCSLSFIRQAYAFAIILLAYRYFKERNHFMVMLFIFIACLFHSTVIIMIPIYILSVLVKPTKLTVLIYGVATLLIYLLSWPILNIAVTIFPQYSGYLNLNFIKVGYNPIYLLVPTVILLLALFARFTGYGKAYPKESSLFTNFAIINFIIWLMSTKHFVIERFSMYVYIFMIMFIPSVVSYYKKCIQTYLYNRKHSSDGTDTQPTPALADAGPRYDCTVAEYFAEKKKNTEEQPKIEKTAEADNTSVEQDHADTASAEQDSGESVEQNSAESEQGEQLLAEEASVSEAVAISETAGEEPETEADSGESKKKKRVKKDRDIPNPDYLPENYTPKKYKSKILRAVTNPIAIFSVFLAVALGFNLWYNYFGLTVSSKGFHGVIPYRSIIPAYMQTALSFEDKEDKNSLLYRETNFLSYLYRLKEADNYTVIISSRSDCVSGMNDAAYAAMKMLGLEKFSEVTKSDNYIAVLSGGEVLYEEYSKDQLEYNTTLEGYETSIISGRKISSIIMGDTDFSTNAAGLNIVVLDNDKRIIVDKVRFKGYYVMLSATR